MMVVFNAAANLVRQPDVNVVFTVKSWVTQAFPVNRERNTSTHWSVRNRADIIYV